MSYIFALTYLGFLAISSLHATSCCVEPPLGDEIREPLPGIVSRMLEPAETDNSQALIQDKLLELYEAAQTHNSYTSGLIKLLQSDSLEAFKYKSNYLLCFGVPLVTTQAVDLIANEFIRNQRCWQFIENSLKELISHSITSDFINSLSWRQYAISLFKEIEQVYSFAHSDFLARPGKSSVLSAEEEQQIASKSALEKAREGLMVIKHPATDSKIIARVRSKRGEVIEVKELDRNPYNLYLLAEACMWGELHGLSQNILEDLKLSPSKAGAVRISQIISESEKLVELKAELKQLEQDRKSRLALKLSTSKNLNFLGLNFVFL